MSGVLAVKTALVDVVLPRLYPTGVQITWGVPVVHVEQDIVCVLDGRADVDIETPGRSLDETGSVRVRWSSWRPGGLAAQRQATEAAGALFEAFRADVRTRPNESLGGVVRWARVESYELEEDGDDERDDDPASGRLTQITAEIAFRHRTTG